MNMRPLIDFMHWVRSRFARLQSEDVAIHIVYDGCSAASFLSGLSAIDLATRLNACGFTAEEAGRALSGVQAYSAEDLTHAFHAGIATASPLPKSSGRPTPNGVEWATVGPDRWEWRGYVVERERCVLDVEGESYYFQPSHRNIFLCATSTMEEAKLACEAHYHQNNPTP